MGEPRVVLERPWWARVLGAGWGAAMLIAVLCPLAAFAPLVALSGDLVSAGKILLVSAGGWALVALGWRVGVTVDGDGITVQNLVFRRRIAWDQVTRLDLADDPRGSPTALIYRRHRVSVEIAALAIIGGPRRLAWFDAVRPILIRNGVAVQVTPMGTNAWRGARLPTDDEGSGL